MSIIQGCKCWDMTMADQIRALLSTFDIDEESVALILNTKRSYINKIAKGFSLGKLEIKWRKRMAQDLTRGMYIFNGRFLAFTKSKEYIDVENGRGMIERIDAGEVLCRWREFYDVGGEV